MKSKQMWNKCSKNDKIWCIFSQIIFISNHHATRLLQIITQTALMYYNCLCPHMLLSFWLDIQRPEGGPFLIKFQI